MNKKSRVILLAPILVALFLTALPSGRQVQDMSDEAWAKSGDPCYRAKQIWAQIKAMTGITPTYLKCKPVRINMDWNIDEVYHHHSGLGDDHLKAQVRVSFRAYLNLSYNQQNRSQLDDYAISGPTPCCPDEATVTPTLLQASILAWKPKGFSGQEFKTYQFSGGAEILTRSDKPGHFGLMWRRDGLEQKTEVAGPAIFLAPGSIPKPYSCGEPVWIMDRHNYRPPQPVEAPSWEELRPYYERQDVWRGKYELDDRTDFPMSMGEFYALRGTVEVEVDFAEEETEDWLMSVEGKETDGHGQSLGSPLNSTPTGFQPPSVAFDWGLGAKLRVRKRKGVRTVQEAILTRFDLVPSLILDPQSTYRCDLVPCQGDNAYDKAKNLVGLAIAGKIQGQAVSVQWPYFPARACVMLTPKGSSGNKVVLRREYGSKEFTDQVGRESLPLRDGASKTGSLGKWLTYRITLKKVD
jgi:hypothetical protein